MTQFGSITAGGLAQGAGPSAQAPVPAVLLVDGNRRLIDASCTAKEMLDEGAVLERSFGCVTATRQGDMVRLERAIAEAHHAGLSSLQWAASGFSADIIRMDQNRPAPAFLILIRQHDRSDGLRAERIARRFGLTPAEIKLLDCLLEGLELKAAAFRLGVARTTARTHLQRIFDKTGVRRQTDLQRMMAFAPQPNSAPIYA